MAAPMRCLFLVLSTTLACLHASAQAQDVLIPELDGPINGMAVVGDTLYFAGSFQTIGARVGPATALDLTTGDVVPGVVPAMDLFYGSGDAIRSVVPDGQGGVYLAGGIRQVEGAPIRHLVHILASGAVDSAFDPGLIEGPNGATAGLRTMSLSDGVLFIEGYLATVGGAPRDGFAALDAATGVVLPFNPSVTDASGYSGIRAAHLHGGVALVIGSFDTAEGQPRQDMAAFDFATGALLPWQAGMDAAGTVTHLVPTAEALYVVGRFSTFGGAPRRGLAELAFPTAADTAPVLTPWAPRFAFASGDFAYASISDVAVSDDALWISGGFSNPVDSYPSTSAPLVRVSRAASAMHAQPVLPYANTLGTYYAGGEAVVSDGGRVWLSVGLHVFQGTENGMVLGIDPVTLQPTGFAVVTGPLRSINGSSAGLDAHIQAMAVVGGRLVVAGRRLELGGVRAPYFGGIDLTTGAILASPSPFPTPVSSLLPSPDGRRMYMREYEPLQGAPARYVELDLATGAQTRFQIASDGRSAAVRDSSAAPPRGAPRYTAHPSLPLIASADRLYLKSAPDGADYTTLSAIDPYTLRSLPGFDAYFRYSATDAQLRDGWIYISGPFENLNGRLHLFYGRLHPQSGEEDPTWKPIATYYGGASGGPMAFVDGIMVTSGRGLKRINTVNTVGGFAAFSRPAGEWQPWNGWIPEGVATVDTRAFQFGNGVFYASGQFDRINNVRQFLTAFDRAGNRLYAWPATQPRQLPRDMFVSERHNRVFVTTEEDQGKYTLYSLPMIGGGTPPVAAAEAPAPSAVSLTVSPNPARSAARLTVSLPEPSASVLVELVDALGRRVALLHNGPLPAMTSQIEVPTQSFPAGVYIVRATGDGVAASTRMVIAR